MVYVTKATGRGTTGMILSRIQIVVLLGRHTHNLNSTVNMHIRCTSYKFGIFCSLLQLGTTQQRMFMRTEAAYYKTFSNDM